MTVPYHLRPNKAVDRFLLIETLKRVFKSQAEKNYTYFSLAGPFLEDCKLVHQFFPEVKLVSLEKGIEEYKRQEFHRFCKHIRLLRTTLKDFLAGFEPQGRQVFWIDYTDLKYENLAWFGELLTKVSDFSVIRITLNCDLARRSRQLHEIKDEAARAECLRSWKEEFVNDYRALVSSDVDPGSFRDGPKYRRLIQELIQVQSQVSLPFAGGRIFQILTSTAYKDSTWMLSVTGIVMPARERKTVTKAFVDWKFANLDWQAPREIRVPVLSVHERLVLQKHLPIGDHAKDDYLHCLGYLIGEDREIHRTMMENYADFHPYYPYFARVTV